MPKCDFFSYGVWIETLGLEDCLVCSSWSGKDSPKSGWGISIYFLLLLGDRRLFFCLFVCLYQKLESNLWRQEPADPKNEEVLRNRKSVMRFPHPRTIKESQDMEFWALWYRSWGRGRDEDQRQKVLQVTSGRFQNIFQKSLVQTACDFFTEGEMKVGSGKTLSDHCPNEGEKPKGARGGE